MKILFLSAYPISLFSNRLGFSACREHKVTWTQNLIKYLRLNEDVEIALATVSSFIDRNYIFKDEGVIYYYIRGLKKRRKLMLYVPDIIGLNRAIRSFKPDIIHARGTENCYALASLWSRCPVLVSIQGAMREYSKMKTNSIRKKTDLKLSALLENLTLRRCHYVIAQTPYIKQVYKDLLDKARIFRLDDPVSEVFFRVINRPHSNVITFVGDEFIRKGSDTLIKIGSLLIEDMPNLEIRIIGAGSTRENKILKRLAADYRILSHVKFLGQIDSPQIAQHLSETKVFVLPTKFDTYGVALAEALCAGVPVVSSRIMGIPYVVDEGCDGYLLPPDDIEGFANRISLLLRNEQMRRKMGEFGRKKGLRRWRPDYVANEAFRVYTEILRMER